MPLSASASASAMALWRCDCDMKWNIWLNTSSMNGRRHCLSVWRRHWRYEMTLFSHYLYYPFSQKHTPVHRSDLCVAPHPFRPQGPPHTHTLKHMSQNTTNCCSWFVYVALGCTCSSNDCHFDISIRSHSLSQTSTKQNWHSHDHWHKQQQLIFIDRLKWRCCFCFRFKCTRVETKNNNNNNKNKSRSLSSVRVSFFILMVGRSDYFPMHLTIPDSGNCVCCFVFGVTEAD